MTGPARANYPKWGLSTSRRQHLCNNPQGSLLNSAAMSMQVFASPLPCQQAPTPLCALDQRHLALPIPCLRALLGASSGAVDDSTDAHQCGGQRSWVRQVCLQTDGSWKSMCLLQHAWGGRTHCPLHVFQHNRHVSSPQRSANTRLHPEIEQLE